MAKGLSKKQTEVYEKLSELCVQNPDGASPTDLGVAMGYPVIQASTRVVPFLKAMISKGLVERVALSRKNVLYKIVS